MQKNTHRILAGGGQYDISSYHFGDGANGPKIALQAALHADELPGIAVGEQLLVLLRDLEKQGAIKGSITLVPIANPMGLSQRILNHPIGRFDVDSGENYNRNYADISAQMVGEVAGQLGQDGKENLAILRTAAKQILARQLQIPCNPVTQLRTTLQMLAIDADYVLDLHCDNEALLHAFTNDACAEVFANLMRIMHGKYVFTADNSGGEPFDESHTILWRNVRELLDAPLAAICQSATVELRGERDVNDTFCIKDAKAIIAFMIDIGIIAAPVGYAPDHADDDVNIIPLENIGRVKASQSGVVVMQKQIGDWVEAGEEICQIIPVHQLDGGRISCSYPASGVLMSHLGHRWAVVGDIIGNVVCADRQQFGASLLQN